MAKELTPPTRTAKIGLTDFEGRFFFQKDEGDETPFTASDLRLALRIKNNDGSVGTVQLKVDDVLTVGERTTLNMSFNSLRDAGLLAAGYVDV